MAKKEFILQGFTTRTHVAAVRELFDIPNIERVVLSVAFVSESGVEQIEEQLTAHADKVTVFAGIRNEITSLQGLTRLHSIVGTKLYTVDTGSRNVVFHPKLYLVRGKTSARVVVGSANLTLGGLNNNIEASMVLEFDLSNEDDLAVVTEIELQLAAIPTDYPTHVVKVGSNATLADLLTSGRIVDELVVSPPRPTTSAGASTNDPIPRIKLKVIPLRRALSKARATAKKEKPPKPTAPIKKGSSLPTPVTPVHGVSLELVWESKPLTERDLNVPTGRNTHATGSINLDKGLLPDFVDQRHYFRDEIFSGLNWTTNVSGKIEEVWAKFQLVLKGVSYGEFDLRIAHSTSTTSTTYLQNNAMTRLSWGAMRDYVAQPSLTGRTLALYRDNADPKRFVLEID